VLSAFDAMSLCHCAELKKCFLHNNKVEEEERRFSNQQKEFFFSFIIVRSPD